MKGKYQYIGLVAALLMTSTCLHAQEEDIRQYLADNLSFTYVKPVHMYRVDAYNINNEEIVNRDTCSFHNCGDFWTNAHRGMENARDLLRGLLGTPENGGDAALQKYAYHICKMLDKPVEIWLYDDTGSINNIVKEIYNPCTDEYGYVWPCANTFTEDEEVEWAGYLHLGAVNMYLYGLDWTKTTFLHELMHTQHTSQLKAHIFHPYTAGQWYIPGLNRSPFVCEAAPGLNAAYQEGVANAINMLYNPAEAKRTFTWFANNDYLLVETTHNKETTKIPVNEWLYNCLREAVGEGDKLSRGDFNASITANYRGYRIQELPPRFIMHNEMIIAMILYQYAKHVSKEKLIKAIKETQTLVGLDALMHPNNKLSQMAKLIDLLCAFGVPQGETVRSIKDLPWNVPKPYLLPLAYVDYFTRYKTQSKKEFSEIFEGALPQYWIDLYWDIAKETVRNGRDTILPDDLDAVAIALDILGSESVE